MAGRSAVCIAIVALALWPAAAQPVAHAVPFTIEATEDVSARFPGFPRLQSFAWAQWDGKWIFIGGRTAGYHGVGGKEADFPRSGANDSVWVIEPSAPGAATIHSVKVDTLPASMAAVKDQWMSSNAAFFQDQENLYIAGGYGQDNAGNWITHSIISVVHLPTLVKAMGAKQSVAAAITYTESPLVQVAGGELLKLDDGAFYLVGGHVFMGSYSDFEAAEEKSGAKASQHYTGEIRKLRFARDAHGKLSVAVEQVFSNPEFERRDLNAGVTIQPDGHTLGAAVYGGVFTKEQLGFSQPIYWTAATAPKVADYSQKMSGYTCAKLAFFDPDSNAMMTTFFGGISQWTWNDERGEFRAAPRVGSKSEHVYFDGMPWIDQITTLVREPQTTYEVVQPRRRLASHVGANGAFLPSAELQRIRPDADVFNLAPLRGRRVLAGYIFGGIRAFPNEFPYREDSPLYRSGNVPTRSNDMIIAVYVTVPTAARGSN